MDSINLIINSFIIFILINHVVFTAWMFASDQQQHDRVWNDAI